MHEKQNIFNEGKRDISDLNQLMAMKHRLKKRTVISREEQSNIFDRGATCQNAQKSSIVLD